ncbi:MAG: hypothetical protein PHT51_03560 [Patescibacteria group bacterium]|nr:hypothetical protein [Patescibacteria group bacterium]MDD4610963.1 hypothetical protein [Patescibacteria group bacterium]
MNFKEFINLIKGKKQTIFVIVFFVIVLVSASVIIQPLKYGSTSRLLVLQNFASNIDPYAVSRSNELLSNVLAEVSTSDSFYNEVMSSGFNIDKSYFTSAGDANKELKKWMKTISVKAYSDRGIIEISVYHPDQYQLNQIAQAVNYIYQTKHQEYHGSGDAVSIKVIDKPIISRWPVKPNILLDLALGIAFGLIISLSYIYLFPEDKYGIKIWKAKVRYSEPEIENEYYGNNSNYREAYPSQPIYKEESVSEPIEAAEAPASVEYASVEPEPQNNPEYIPANSELVVEPVRIDEEVNSEGVEMYNSDSSDNEGESYFNGEGNMKNILE